MFLRKRIYLKWLITLYIIVCMGLQAFSSFPYDLSLFKEENKSSTGIINHLENPDAKSHVLNSKLQIHSTSFLNLKSENSSGISIEVELLNCQAWENCNANPQVEFAIKGENHRELAGSLVIQIGSNKTTCKDQFCIMDMPVTNEKGQDVNYWAESIEGGILLSKSFKMRNRIIGDDGSLHYFEVMGDDFPYPIDTCASVWEIFPEEEELQSSWLKKAESADDLYTEVDYALLAGRLIWYGYVDASECADGGMLLNGSASTCGIEKASDKIIEVQNRYNQEILNSALEIDIPSRLLKGLVAQESQFWSDWQIENEYGYGMISDMGMDMLLNWNTDFYLKLCMSYYSEYQCMSGFSSLSEEQQTFLKNVCLSSAGTDKEFQIIANTLKAGCFQTQQLVENITDKSPDSVFSYGDLWRINLGIYNTGAGCMAEAIECAWDAYERAMTWEEFIEYIPSYCANASTYFDKVVHYGANDSD